MHRDYVLWNLQEAAEAIATTISELRADDDDVDANAGLWVNLTHVYHHLNTAWNARNASDERVSRCSEDDVREWRQFPHDIDMGV